MDVLRRSARKSSLEKVKNKNVKEILGAKGKPDIIDIIEKKDYKRMATSRGCPRREYRN
jgi:hypothetical protein